MKEKKNTILMLCAQLKLLLFSSTHSHESKLYFLQVFYYK
jgi:hypothetical protein